MKIKKEFIVNVIENGQIITKDFIYWAKEIEGEPIRLFIVKRASTKTTFVKSDGNIYPNNFEYVGIFGSFGDRY